MDTLEKKCRACGRARPAAEDFCPFCTAPAIPSPPRQRSSFAVKETALETRCGGGPENPGIAEMRPALIELDTPDMEHPSTWLTDEDDWPMDVYEHGLVIFSHGEDKICERSGVTRSEALELWLLLQQGRREEITTRLGQ